MKKFRALLLGDIVGTPGCRALFYKLKNLKQKLKAQFVLVNGENAFDGFGLDPDTAYKFFDEGVDVITSGNHIWQQQDIFPLLKEKNRVLRPENYPAGTIGTGTTIIDSKGEKVAIINLQGRNHMDASVDCPFRLAKKIVQNLSADIKIRIVDFHAEDVLEKEALALYLDGKISSLVGTHTHIQTADERILDKGTSYITDLGMVGPKGSIIGNDPQISIRRMMTQLPLRMEPLDNDALICGVIVDIDPETGKTISIERVREE